jgi:hypothetical protein
MESDAGIAFNSKIIRSMQHKKVVTESSSLSVKFFGMLYLHIHSLPLNDEYMQTEIKYSPLRPSVKNMYHATCFYSQ